MRAPAALRLIACLVALAGTTGLLTTAILAAAETRERPGAVAALPLAAGPAAQAVAAGGPSPPPAASAPTPAPLRDLRAARCFGAASADPGRPCVDPRLRAAVVPTPAVAASLQRPQGCRRRFEDGLLRICFWGAPAARATRTVALIGDSHASHWRAALQTVVTARRWRAISISRAGCPLVLAEPRLPGRARRVQCQAWNQQVQRWVARRPGISVVFTGSHRIGVVPARGESEARTRERGYVSAWRRLHVSGVRQVVVFRDTPRIPGAALRCVQEAALAGADGGTACALPRAYALPPDPAADAARTLASPRVQVADLSPFFCDRAVCRPVVGGALVLRDVSHMTTTFSASLGPYLLRTVDELMRTWADA